VHILRKSFTPAPAISGNTNLIGTDRFARTIIMLLLFALTQLLDAQGTDPLKERLDKYNTYLDL